MFCSLKGWVKRCYTDRQLLIREQNILTIFLFYLVFLIELRRIQEFDENTIIRVRYYCHNCFDEEERKTKLKTIFHAGKYCVTPCINREDSL